MNKNLEKFKLKNINNDNKNLPSKRFLNKRMKKSAVLSYIKHNPFVFSFCFDDAWCCLDKNTLYLFKKPYANFYDTLLAQIKQKRQKKDEEDSFSDNVLDAKKDKNKGFLSNFIQDFKSTLPIRHDMKHLAYKTIFKEIIIKNKTLKYDVSKLLNTNYNLWNKDLVFIKDNQKKAKKVNKVLNTNLNKVRYIDLLDEQNKKLNCKNAYDKLPVFDAKMKNLFYDYPHLVNVVINEKALLNLDKTILILQKTSLLLNEISYEDYNLSPFAIIINPGEETFYLAIYKTNDYKPIEWYYNEADKTYQTTHWYNKKSKLEGFEHKCVYMDTARLFKYDSIEGLVDALKEFIKNKTDASYRLSGNIAKLTPQELNITPVAIDESNLVSFNNLIALINEVNNIDKTNYFTSNEIINTIQEITNLDDLSNLVRFINKKNILVQDFDYKENTAYREEIYNDLSPSVFKKIDRYDDIDLESLYSYYNKLISNRITLGRYNVSRIKWLKDEIILQIQKLATTNAQIEIL